MGDKRGYMGDIRRREFWGTKEKKSGAQKGRNRIRVERPEDKRKI